MSVFLPESEAELLKKLPILYEEKELRKQHLRFWKKE